MTLIPMTMNYSVHSMPLDRRHNVKRAARRRGGQYEHDSGSSQQQGGGLLGRFMRSSSQRAQTTQTQTRIDTS
jgi:hypothetical protein